MRALVKAQYFSAALELLAGGGFQSLNIGVLCRTLGVTSGSFYHHFGSWDGFVTQLLEHWELTAVERLEEMQFGFGDAGEDIKALRTLTLSLNHSAEAALRAWGANNPGVGAAVARVDHGRVRTVRRAIGRTIPNPRTSNVITQLGMDMLVGHQLREAAGDRVEFSAVLDEYLALVHSHSQTDGPLLMEER